MSAVRSVADVAQVCIAAGYELRSYTADIHSRWEHGDAVVYVTDDLCGSLSVTVVCPAWEGPLRLPLGVSRELVEFVAAAARDDWSVRVSGRAS